MSGGRSARAGTRSARSAIERAFHVSFKLPEQAAELLDSYRAEVRAETLKELLAGLRLCGLEPADELLVALMLRTMLS